MKKLGICNKGFTLVELMVAIAILGLVLMAITTTFIGQRRSGLTQDDVADAQQSVRIGLETLARDIRNAGLLIPKNGATFPVATAGIFNITLTVGSVTDIYATIENPTDADGNITGLTDPITFTVNDARDFQNRSGSEVRIVRPSTGDEPGRDDGAKDVCYTATYISPTELSLAYVSSTSLPTGGIADITFAPGDTIFLHDCASAWPVQIIYSLDPDPGPTGTPDTTLSRNLLRNGEIIAQNIVVPDANIDGTADDRDSDGRPDSLFIYLDRNGNETADRANITAVKVDITTGTTRNVAQLDNQARTRQLTSLVRIKNKFD